MLQLRRRAKLPFVSDIHLILDFDSTLVGVETLDLLAEVALHGRKDAEAVRREVARITDAAMEGRLDFGEALRARLDLIRPGRAHLDEVAALLPARLTPSVARNLDALRRLAGQIHIVSGGFDEAIWPVADHLGIARERVLANRLIFDDAGLYAGLDDTRPLSREGGKVEAIAGLALPGTLVMIGDGHSDWQVREAGVAARFHAFTEVVRRERVVARADHEARTLDEVLHREGLLGRWSYPRSRIRVLLLEGVHPLAVRRLTDEGYSVEVRDGALDEAALIEAVRGVHVLGVRSKSEVSARVIEAADRLLAVGAFCIGVNQIDLEACRRRGIAVFNAPHSNTRSVVELAIGHIIALSRGVIDHDRRMKSGLWQKSASGAHEVRGKTLGIVGYGAIGTQLSVLAETLGMSVVFHDLVERLALGNAWRARTLDEVLRVSDVVSLHVDGRASNAHLIGAREITAMKRGAALINLSRGHVLDLDAAAEALRSGQLSGLALDVYPHEPAANGPGFECPLAGLANVILTPHIGGSTEEAQAAIADFAAERLLAYLGRGDTTFCVNLPNVQLAEVSGAHRILHIHENRPGVLADLNRALSEAGLNILGQHLKTLDDVGYVITDVDADYDPAHMRRLKDNPATLRFRLLY